MTNCFSYVDKQRTLVTFYCFNASFGCCEFRLLLYIAYIVVNGLRCHMTTLNFGVIKNNQVTTIILTNNNADKRPSNIIKQLICIHFIFFASAYKESGRPVICPAVRSSRRQSVEAYS